MEKYPHVPAVQDEWGHPISKGHDDPEKEYDGTDTFLRDLAEGRTKTWTEKYGSHDGFGLVNKKRYIRGQDGQLIPWDAAGKDWRLATGYYNRKLPPGTMQSYLPGTSPPRYMSPNRGLLSRPLLLDRADRHGPAQPEQHKEGEEHDESTISAAPQVFRIPTDIVQLNLDAWEDRYRAATESGMFVRRHTATQIKKERLALQTRLKHEMREAAAREKATTAKQREDNAPLTPWEEEGTAAKIETDERSEISQLPPSQRKERDPRIGEGPTFGAEPPPARPERSAWSERKRDTRPELAMEDQAREEWDRAYKWRGPVEDEDAPNKARTASLRGDRRYAQHFAQSLEDAPLNPSESEPRSSPLPPPPKSSFAAKSRLRSGLGSGFGMRSYSTARIVVRRSQGRFGMTSQPTFIATGTGPRASPACCTYR